MNHIFEISAACYLVIGTFLGTIGPAGKNISEEVRRARGTPFTNEVMEREQPSEFKLMLFRVIVTMGFILLWPFFIYSIIKDQRLDEILKKELEEIRAGGLWFQYNMGGCGTVTCGDCNHSESVTSFIHGIDSSSTGFQCQSCGKLEAIESGGP